MLNERRRRHMTVVGNDAYHAMMTRQYYSHNMTNQQQQQQQQLQPPRLNLTSHNSGSAAAIYEEEVADLNYLVQQHQRASQLHLPSLSASTRYSNTQSPSRPTPSSTTLTNQSKKQPPEEAHPFEINYPDFDQWLQTAGNIGYVTSVMLARSKSESTLSEMSDMTNNRRRIFTISKKSQKKSRLNYHDLGKIEHREGIRQHQVALLRWTNLVGKLSKQLSSAFAEFSKSLEETANELRSETEKTNQMFKTETAKDAKPSFVLGRSLDKIWLTVLDNVSDQSRIFGELSRTLNGDFAPAFTDVIDHHQMFIGQIYAFECGLENLLSEYRQSTEKSFETAELAKQLVIQRHEPRSVPKKSGLGSLAFAVDAQNAYVLNLHNYNTMVTQYENSLMPVLVEEMEEASSDLMTYGVKFLDAITQLVGKRYGELKGRMEVVEFACRYQSKARSDISAYVRAYLDSHKPLRKKPGKSDKPNFSPIVVTSQNQLVAMEDNEHKLSEAADALSTEIYEMADLRRSKQAELEQLEEKYRACMSNINNLAPSSAQRPSVASVDGGGSGGASSNKSQSKSKQDCNSPVVKDALPSFSNVTFGIKENIAESKRVVALATAKLNSLKHQMDLLSAARHQPPPSSIEAEFQSPMASTSQGASGRPPRLPHQSGGNVKHKRSIKRSLTQWFSFLSPSNHEPGSQEKASVASSGRSLSSSQKQSNSLGMIPGTTNSTDELEVEDDHPDMEYHPFMTGEEAATSARRSSRPPKDQYYHATYDQYKEGNAQDELASDEDGALPGDHKQKSKVFSVKSFKKTFDRLRKMASEDNPSELPSRRRRNPHRMQTNEPDPVYALLKCAATLKHVNLENHASNCECDECPARRLVSGVSTSLVPPSLGIMLPGIATGQGSSPASHSQPSKQSSQETDDPAMHNSSYFTEHPAQISSVRNRLSSVTTSDGLARSSSNRSPKMRHGHRNSASANQRSSMIVMSTAQAVAPIVGSMSSSMHQQPGGMRR